MPAFARPVTYSTEEVAKSMPCAPTTAAAQSHEEAYTKEDIDTVLSRYQDLMAMVATLRADHEIAEKKIMQMQNELRSAEDVRAMRERASHKLLRTSSEMALRSRSMIQALQADNEALRQSNIDLTKKQLAFERTAAKLATTSASSLPPAISPTCDSAANLSAAEIGKPASIELGERLHAVALRLAAREQDIQRREQQLERREQALNQRRISQLHPNER